MKTAFETDLKSKTFCITKNYPLLVEKKVSLVSFKFYQKLFVFLISFSTILIFPESPKELENICESYNSLEKCVMFGSQAALYSDSSFI